MQQMQNIKKDIEILLKQILSDAGLSLSLAFAFQTTFNIFSPYARLKRNPF